jgi:thiol-disulfide isomerase/thioredoxin
MLKRFAAAAALVLACGGVMAQDTKAPKQDQPKAEQPKQEAKKTTEGDMPKLMVGDKAPALTVSKWVKGEPVTGFEKGKTYVVEFWATWCGPCKASIPHLTELQKEHKDVKFIGVSVWESDQSAVEPFVKDEMGEKMDYTVAMDEVPAPKDETRQAQRNASSNGKMSKNWMEASGANGIPTAFIVNGEGKVAWIGHPMVKMDEALEKVISGKQDLAADATEYRKGKEAEAKTKGPMRKFQQAMQESDYTAALAAIDEVVEANPKMAKQMASTKYMILLNEMKDFDKAYAYGHKLVEGEAKDDANLLNNIAWYIVDPDNLPEKQDLALAEKASKASCELTKNANSMYVDTLAAVYYAKKEYGKAAETQEKAVKLAEGEANLDPQMVQEMKERLEKFKKAAAGGGS